MPAAKPGEQNRRRQQPGGEQDERQPARAGRGARPGRGRRLPCLASAAEERPRAAEQRRRGDDGRKGHVEQEERGERPAGQQPCKPALERPRADAEQRLHHQRQHRRLDAEEGRLDRRQPPVERIDRRQRGHHDRAGQDEQEARRQAAAYAVQQPAGIGGELLRLRPRQQHAEIERMEETRLVKPALLLHHDAVHERDLRRRPAEAGEPDPRPGGERLSERDGRGRRRRLRAQPSQTCSGSGRPRKSSSPSGPSVSMSSISWINMSCLTCWAGCQTVRSNTSCSACAP